MTYQLSTPLTLLPEWADQEAVILAWPHAKTDWAPWIDDARATYVELINAINNAGAIVILLCQQDELGLVKSMVSMNAQVAIFVTEYNDTWTRDYAFLTCESENGNTPVEFTFNGWGEKFDARKDNAVNERLATLCRQPLQSCPTICEGGALEIDQNQTLLSTASCLYNPKRNGDMSEDAYRQTFSQYLGATNTVTLNHGYLEGDDTDGHIDTLVRFTPLHGIVIQAAQNMPEDEHYAPLNALVDEVRAAFPSHSLYLLPLPKMHNQQGDRLPASYANFLILNRSVLVPTYCQEEDREALEVIEKAFPNHKTVAVDCSTIIQQFGSLHCITMQVPENTLESDIIERAKQGLFEI